MSNIKSGFKPKFAPSTDNPHHRLPNLLSTILLPLSFLLTLIAILTSAAPLLAAQVTLAWEANSPTPDGYRLFLRPQGGSYNYDAPVWSGTATSCTIGHLSEDTTYFFTVRAYEGSAESGDSNEVYFSGSSQPPLVVDDDPPVADAGPNQTVTAGTHVMLNGTGSFDPEGTPLRYLWTQTGGASVQLSATDTPRPHFTAPQVPAGQSALLVFELTVTDGGALTCGDTCIVQINPTGSADSEDDPSDPAQHSFNQPPWTPEILSPQDGETSVSMPPIFSASPFADPDTGDAHSKSEWLIMTANTQATVFHAFRTDRSLTRLRLPHLILEGATSYFVLVRYYDDQGAASLWSPPVTFTTQCPKNAWCDLNGSSTPTTIPKMDLNANNIPDADEPQVIRTVQSLDGRWIGVSVEEINSEIDGAIILDPNTDDTAMNLMDPDAFDLFTYRVLVDQPGAESLIKIHFSQSLDTQAEWICNDAAGQWIEEFSEIYPQENDPAVIRMVEDGGPEDADGVANGVIIDILGVNGNPAPDGSQNSLGNPGGSSGSSCFIGALFE